MDPEFHQLCGASLKIILGIDPGSINLGYGLVGITNGRIEYLKHGVFSCSPTVPFQQRIYQIAEQLEQLFAENRPHITVIENIFLGKNADSAFKLGHIRGICLLYAAKSQSEIVEYAAKSVKKGITGSGAASKEQVQMLLYALLGLRGAVAASEKIDASDALSLAYYHAKQIETEENMTRGLGVARRGRNNEVDR